jgi:glutathione S-transferase
MPMTLYNSDLSPYAARIRMQVRAKGLEREIVITGKPEGDAYKAISFTGKVPCLDTGMDYALVESDTIAEFI